MGNEEPITPKAFRRGNANVMNRKAPDAVRDQALLLSQMGYVQFGVLAPDPEIEALKQRREILKDGRYRYKGQDRKSESCQEHQNETSATRPRGISRGRPQVKKNWRNWRKPGKPEIDLQIPERRRAGWGGVSSFSTGSAHLRGDAGAHLFTLSTLCSDSAKAGRRLDAPTQRAQVQPNITDATPPDPHIFPLLMLKTQCPRCIGDGRLSYQERTFTYSRPAVMTIISSAHMSRRSETPSKQTIFCEHPTCVEEGVKLDDLDHFRNHVQVIIVCGSDLGLRWDDLRA
ncbi:hypothetical protein PG985_016350 [Apiospora marii]|uniref:uncharacterized protein n=1 Tax=Apiospora marii TaxID=335849 RepID=UPI00312F6963